MTHDSSSGQVTLTVQHEPGNVRDAVKLYHEVLNQNQGMPVTTILPLFFNFQGKPYSIDRGHFPFEPQFRMARVPQRQILKCGRQVGKSLSTAATGILRGAMTPYFQHLTVTPLFEQVRKFSSNYVKPFLKECSFRSSIIAPGTDNSVLQRTLSNGSNLFYNYASNSADRIRGTPADEVDCDEMQDFDLTVLPVIESCLGASKYKLLRFSGTPKTFDGPLQVYWNKSSQAIWHIPCMTLGCNTINKCSAYDGHLIKMIDHPKTLVCHKCAQPLNSRIGYYVHTYPDRQWSFPGYHMPQVIFPMHYEDPKAWHLIQQNLKEKPKYIIWNELLGESLDTGMKLLTLEELQAVSKLPAENPTTFNTGRYVKTALGVDWGGKGKEKVQDKDEFISNTALALAGLRSDGIVEIRWLWKTPYEANATAEAQMVVESASNARVDWMAHDFGGAGNVREDIILGSGYPAGKIAPFTYSIMSPNKPIVFYEPAGTRGVRSSWTLDKTRAISLFCELVKRGKILLPNYDEYRDFLQDFFNVFEQTNESPRGKVKIIQKVPHQTDDVVHACVFAAMALYHSTEWPVLAESYQPQITVSHWEEGDL